MPKKLDRDDVSTKATMSFRPSPRLREDLGAAAARAGRSVSQEAEWRLERYLEWEASDPLFQSFMQAALNVARSIESVRGGKISTDRDVARAASQALKVLADIMIGGVMPAALPTDLFSPEAEGTLVAAVHIEQWSREQARKADLAAKWAQVQRDALAYDFLQIDERYPESPNMTAQARNGRQRERIEAVRRIFFDHCEAMSDDEVVRFMDTVSDGSYASTYVPFDGSRDPGLPSPLTSGEGASTDQPKKPGRRKKPA